MKWTWPKVTSFLFFTLIYFPASAGSVSHLGANVAPDDVVLLNWQCNIGTPTRVLSDGTLIENFAIPRKQVLVITDFEWRITSSPDSEGLNYILEAQLNPGGGVPVTVVYGAFIELIQTRGYLSDHLTSAIVLDSTVTLDNDATAPAPSLNLFGVAPGAGFVPNCKAILRGYLARERGRGR